MADRLSAADASGIDPQVLLGGFSEGKYDEGDQYSSKTIPQAVESASNDPSSDGQINGVKLEVDDEGRRIGEAIESHKAKYGLSADNLEEDARYQEIYSQLKDEWLKNNPEPIWGSDASASASERQRWLQWAERRDRFFDQMRPRAGEIFQSRYPNDYAKYKRYGVYDNLDEDPRYKDIFGAEKRRLTAIAEYSGNVAVISLAESFAKSSFARIYPDTAAIYAIRDQDLAGLLIKPQEASQATRQAESVIPEAVQAPESGQIPHGGEIKAAEKLIDGLKNGVDPELLLSGFSEGEFDDLSVAMLKVEPGVAVGANGVSPTQENVATTSNANSGNQPVFGTESQTKSSEAMPASANNEEDNQRERKRMQAFFAALIMAMIAAAKLSTTAIEKNKQPK